MAGILWVRFNILPSRVASRPVLAGQQKEDKQEDNIHVEFPGLTGWRTELWLLMNYLKYVYYDSIKAEMLTCKFALY